MIRIIGSEINLRHRALEVYVSGCIRDCPGCHNPEAQAFGNGMRWDKWLTANRYKLGTGTFRNVWILGGDLLCQPDPAEVEEFLRSFRLAMPEEMDLWLWTGADRESVPSSVLRHIDWLKTGIYLQGLPDRDVRLPDGTWLTLASGNQELEHVPHPHQERRRKDPR